MRRRALRYLFLCGILIVTLGTSLPGLAASTTIQVFVHEGGTYLENTKRFFEEFERRNPEYEIEIISGPPGASPEEKLAIMIAAGVSPDLARLWNTKQAARTGLLQDITPYFERFPQSIQDDMWGPIREALSFDGKLYALPMGTAVSMYFYNPRMFAERGVGTPDDSWTWEDQGTNELRKLTVDRDGDGRPDVYAMTRAGGQTYHVYSFIYAAEGGPVFSQDGRQFFGNSAATIDALQFLHDLAHVHQVMPATGSSYTDFLNENTASMIWGSFMLGYFDPFPDLSWEIAALPSYKGNHATSLWPETPYGIPVGAKNPEAAWKVLEFIYSPEGQELAMELGWGIPPARASVARDSFTRAFDFVNINALIQSMQWPLNQPMPHQAPSEATRLLSQAFQEAIAGTKSPAQAIEEVTPVIEGILSRE